VTIIEYLILTTKKKGITAEGHEGTETNGHQAHSIHVDNCSPAAMLLKSKDSQASQLQLADVRSIRRRPNMKTNREDNRAQLRSWFLSFGKVP
jgi:hypothetical protein